MALFSKKKHAFAMLGNQVVLKRFIEIKVFDDYDIELVNRDFVTVDELSTALEKDKQTEYVLISDQALIGIENGKYEIIKKLREKHPDVFIVMFINNEKHDEAFINWAFGYKVYNIYYPFNDDGEFDLSKIVPEIAAKVMPAVKSSESLVEKENELSKRESELKAKESEITKIEEKLLKLKKESENKAELKEKHNNEEIEVKIESLKKELKAEKSERENALDELERIKRESAEEIEKIRSTIPEKEIITKVKTVVKGTGSTTIGVFSVSRGAGSTYTSCIIAEKLVMLGYSAAVVAFDGKSDLEYAEGKADYYFATPDKKKLILLQVINGGYDFVIIDFGTPFMINARGELENFPGNAEEHISAKEELMRTAFRIGLAPSEPWHLNKLLFFEKLESFNEHNSIFKVHGLEKLSSKYHRQIEKCSLPICDGDDSQLLMYFLNLVGIEEGITEQEKEKPKGRKIFGRQGQKEKLI